MQKLEYYKSIWKLPHATFDIISFFISFFYSFVIHLIILKFFYICYRQCPRSGVVERRYGPHKSFDGGMNFIFLTNLLLKRCNAHSQLAIENWVSLVTSFSKFKDQLLVQVYFPSIALSKIFFFPFWISGRYNS